MTSRSERGDGPSGNASPAGAPQGTKGEAERVAISDETLGKIGHQTMLLAPTSDGWTHAAKAIREALERHQGAARVASAAMFGVAPDGDGREAVREAAITLAEAIVRYQDHVTTCDECDDGVCEAVGARLWFDVAEADGAYRVAKARASDMSERRSTPAVHPGGPKEGGA